MEPIAIKLHQSVRNVPPRGGSSMVEVQGNVLIFGGVDREQIHYQDLVVYQKNRADKQVSFFEQVNTSGDIPLPRSGHGMVAYGKYVIVFDGIDFAQEYAFDDLYLLDTDTWEWSSIGESGVEVAGRNSHSFCILTNSTESYLVVYGGASPERGPLDDVCYAKLPSPESIEPASFYVEWKQLVGMTNSPGVREMHSTCAALNTMVITGGRDAEGNMLSDVWSLVLLENDEHNEGSEEPLQWQKWESCCLPELRCAHVASFVMQSNGTRDSSTDGEADWKICIFGGFTNRGESSEVLHINLELEKAKEQDQGYTTPRSMYTRFSPCRDIHHWDVANLNNGPAGRFGHAICSLSSEFVLDIWQNTRYKPLFLTQNDIISAKMSKLEIQCHQNHVALMLFGGVNAEEDFADIWLLLL